MSRKKEQPIVVLSEQEWKQQGERLFGKDVMNWRFKCPNCGGVQKIQDFIDLGVADPQKVVLYECTTRYNPVRACGLTLNGMIPYQKVEVLQEDGTRQRVFEFADPEEVAQPLTESKQA